MNNMIGINMAEPAKKLKVESSTKCKNANHTFIVTEWFIKGGHQKAGMMRCQHCLMPMNLEEIETQEWKVQNGLENV